MGRVKDMENELKNETMSFSDWMDFYAVHETVESLVPTRVIYDFPYTIVQFSDDVKTVVKCHSEAYDYEKGLAMAIARRVTTRANFDRLVEEGKRSFENKMEKFRKGKKES